MLFYVKRSLFGIAIISLALITFSCSTMAGRYIQYRLSPDEVKTEGVIDVPVSGKTDHPVTIYLDDFGVPHIVGYSERDIFFALGYMQGRDRRFQLEMYKMLGYGRMREFVGDRDKTGALKQMERVSRMLGFYEDARRLLEEAPEEDVELLEAFSDGVNEATKKEPVPMEFQVLDYSPDPWTPEDSMVIFAMISFGLCKNWENELARLELIIHQLREGQSINRALRIFKPVFTFPPHLTASGEAEKQPRSEFPLISPELVEYLCAFTREYPVPDLESPENTEELTECGISQLFRGTSASNNWAVDGRWTGTGRAAFATDSHMPHMLPPMGYLFHLHKMGKGSSSAGYSIIGGGFAGLPAVAFGTNGNVAWGATSNWADVTDLYVIQCVDEDDRYYVFEDEPLPFKTRTEVFKIRQDDGSYREETYTVRETRHGVILNDFIERIGDAFPLVALRRNRMLGEPLSALRRVYQSKNVRQTTDAFLHFYAFTGHWVMADAYGNISYAGSVRLPDRKNHLGTLPVPGWLQRYAWQGYVDIKQLPFVINPPSGFLGTANNQVIDPSSVPYPINFEGSVPFRYQRIKEVLDKSDSSGRKEPELRRSTDATSVVDIMADLQMDDTFLGWRFLRSKMEEVLTPLVHEDSLEAEAAATLLAWNGCNLGHCIGPTIFNVFQIQAFIRAMEDEVSPKTLNFYLSYYNLEPFVYDLLHDPSNPAWDNISTEKRETYKEALLQAFRDTVRLCTAAYGKDVSRWRWDRAANFVLEHPFGTEKALAGYVNRGPLPLHGATDTLFAHQLQRIDIDRFDVKGGPVLRVVVDFNDWAHSFMSIPGGESGRPSSKHYDDILPLYMDGRGVPLYTDLSQLAETARGILLLQ